MYEVELKVRADHVRVRDRLDDMDATPLGRVVQVDTYYDAPHRDFAATDEALRIREQHPSGDDGEHEDATETRITYKGPRVDEESKTREERETAVTDGDAMADILDGLGFEPAATVRKERERFAVGRYTVTLDAVDGLGEFVEVETETTGNGVDTAREGAVDLLADIGLDADDGIRTSYLGLLLGADGDD